MSQTKKISIMHITYDMRIGGTEMVIKNIIDGSDESLFSMSIFCIESPLGPFASELLGKGITISSYARQPGFDVSLINKLKEHIKKNNIDILHCHQYTPYIYGVLAALFTRTQVIFTEHGRFYPDSSSWKRKILNPILNCFTASTTAISKATKQALIDYENIPNDSIQVIYNGIAAVHFDPSEVVSLKQKFDIVEGQLCLGTIARLDPIKNHLMMLESFKLVLDAGVNAKLIIVGDGEERINIEAKIQTLSLDKHVVMTGYESKPQNLMAMMDIYLLSSLSEGTSMTLLEAMSIGKPCVVTDAGGNSEVIENNKVGIVTPNDNADAFAQAIIYLANKPNEITNFGHEASRRFNQLFSLEHMNCAYKELYLTHSQGANS